MFCTACGKQIIDTARFCNYCGAPVAGAAPTAPAAPVTPTAPVSAPAESSPVSVPVSENIQSDISFENTETVAEDETALTSGYSQIPGEETLSAEPQTADNENPASYGEISAPVSNVEAPSVPDPVLEPVINTEAGNVYSLPAPNQIPMNGEGNVHAAAVPGKPAKPLPERKYTLGHIMMCLGAVAIMAIVAGVFAGLYFSVV